MRAVRLRSTVIPLATSHIWHWMLLRFSTALLLTCLVCVKSVNAQHGAPQDLQRKVGRLFLRELHRSLPPVDADSMPKPLVLSLSGLSPQAAAQVRAQVRQGYRPLLSNTHAHWRRSASIDSLWVRGDSATVRFSFAARSRCPADSASPEAWAGSSTSVDHLFLRREGAWVYSGSQRPLYGDGICLYPPRTPPEPQQHQ